MKETETKDFRDMTLNELDKYLRNNGIDDFSTIAINLESGTRVTFIMKPMTAPIGVPYTPYPSYPSNSIPVVPTGDPYKNGKNTYGNNN